LAKEDQEMRMFAVAALAAALAVPAMSMADDQSTHLAPKPTSFVPHSNSGRHVYGSPIGQPIVGRAKPSHHKQPPKKHTRAVSRGAAS
jgi:hypothetical protein